MQCTAEKKIEEAEVDGTKEKLAEQQEQALKITSEQQESKWSLSWLS